MILLAYCLNVLLLSLVASQVVGVSERLRNTLDSSVLMEQWETSRLQGQAALIKELT